MARRLKLLLPWLLTLGIVGWLLSRTDVDAIWQALVRADLAALSAVLVGFSLVVFVADAATLTLLFRRFCAPMPYGEVLAVKGVSYFLNAINYSAASGGMALFIQRKRGVPFLRGLSSLLWLNFVDVVALVAMLAVGLLFGHDLLPGELGHRVPWVLGVGALVVTGALVYWNAGIDFLVLGRLRGWRIFETFREARLSDYARMAVVRAAFISLYVGLAWAALPYFDIHIPLGTLLIYTPLLTFVQIVPASISGLGAIQVVMVALFAPHVGPASADAAAQVLAYSTISGPGMTLLRLGLGYAFVANIARDFVPRASDIAEAAADEAR